MSCAPAKTVVYVVDDDQGVLGSLRFLLETDGFEVRTFRSGPALLGYLERWPCGLHRDRLQNARDEWRRSRAGLRDPESPTRRC